CSVRCVLHLPAEGSGRDADALREEAVEIGWIVEAGHMRDLRDAAFAIEEITLGLRHDPLVEKCRGGLASPRLAGGVETRARDGESVGIEAEAALLLEVEFEKRAVAYEQIQLAAGRDRACGVVGDPQTEHRYENAHILRHDCRVTARCRPD